MPYLGIEAEYTAEELEKMSVKVGRYTGMSVSYAIEAIEKRGLSYTVVGDPDGNKGGERHCGNGDVSLRG